MTPTEMTDVLVRHSTMLADLDIQVRNIMIKEQRIDEFIQDIHRRITAAMDEFHRDRYKSVDYRLRVIELSHEILIYDHLGHNLEPAAKFLMAIAALLEERLDGALEYFDAYLRHADAHDIHRGNAYYLCGMINYNTRRYSSAIECFRNSFRLSPETDRDWQSQIYVCELLFLSRAPDDVIEQEFTDTAESLKGLGGRAGALLQATFYLKWGNVYVEPMLPGEKNSLMNNPKAIRLYKQARTLCPAFTDTLSLLAIVIDYSLAQAMSVEKRIDLEIITSPQQLFIDVLQRLRRVVLTKTEPLILAQLYFMMGTCVLWSTSMPPEVGEICLEHARQYTLTLPSQMAIYSCITKELLSREDAIKELDVITRQLETLRRGQRR